MSFEERPFRLGRHNGDFHTPPLKALGQVEDDLFCPAAVQVGDKQVDAFDVRHSSHSSMVMLSRAGSGAG